MQILNIFLLRVSVLAINICPDTESCASEAVFSTNMYKKRWSLSLHCRVRIFAFSHLVMDESKDDFKAARR